MTSAFIQVLSWLLMAATAASPAQTPPRGSTRSPHGQLSISCENCHTLNSWKPIRPIPEFDHNKTRFPLRGLHAGVACRLCHMDLVFRNVGMACADCHADIHRRQFGAQCEQCHTVKGWQVTMRAVREHQNRFPLIGAHAAVDCNSCHKGAAVGQFTGLNIECMSCHLSDYQQARSFDHRAAGLPTTCQICHAMDSWSGAKFDHSRYTGFALTGAHARLECTACHIGGRYAGTPSDCYSCHRQDYTGTTNPNHVAAGFPTTCSTCHTTSTWSGARFDHKFPIYSGKHAGKWTTCNDCHTNPSNYAVFTCFTCHVHDKIKMDDTHRGVPSYVYNSANCYACHPLGSK